MAQDHTLMASRWELKYLIPHRLAVRVRNFVAQHLELDEFGVGRPNNAYPVHSLYLDTPDGEIERRTINGEKNRYKLRIRYYNDDDRTPVFWEVKRRMKDIILKQRCAIRRPFAASVVNGLLPSPHEMFAPDNPRHHRAIRDFMKLQFNIGAGPALQVAYDREAYVHPTKNEVRVTFDRNVRVQPRTSPYLNTPMDRPFACTGPGTDPDDVVILELKFTDRFPAWYQTLVETFHLMQGGASKYCEGCMVIRGAGRSAAEVMRSMVL